MAVRRKEYFACQNNNTGDVNEQYEKADRRFLELLLADNVEDVQLNYKAGQGFIIEYVHHYQHDFHGEEDS